MNLKNQYRFVKCNYTNIAIEFLLHATFQSKLNINVLCIYIERK